MQNEAQIYEQKPKKKIRWWFVLLLIFVIIPILMVIINMVLGIFAFDSAKVKSRDARRFSDIKMIQSGLQIYYDTAGRYPNEIIPGESLSFQGATYMQAVPINPKPNDGKCSKNFEYQYVVGNNGQSYKLTYCLGVGFGGQEKGYHTITK